MNKFYDILNNYIKDWKDNRVVVYGTGVNAKDVLYSASDLDVVAFLDGKKNKKEFCGKKIIELDEIISLDVHVILIASAVKNEKIIFDRIFDFCQNNNITIYGLYGGDLSNLYDNRLIGYDDNSYQCNKEELYKLIDNHEAISFDIFDTLITRRTLEPYDVFDIVENRAKKYGINIINFKVYRLRAEYNVLNINHTLDSIYDEVKKICYLTDEQKDILKKLELEVELDVIIPRSDMVEALRYAYENNKKINLITDMYLNKNQIKYILASNGINTYNKIFISGEYKTNKQQDLFNSYKCEVHAASYLHIGDNKIADGYFARLNGMTAVVIRSGLELIKQSTMNYVLELADNPNERNILGMIVSDAYNSPYTDYNACKIKISKEREFAFYFIAPLLAGVFSWLFNKLETEKYDRILFLSRDGFLFNKLYNEMREQGIIKNNVTSNYILMSRVLGIRIGISDENEIKKVLNGFGKIILNKLFKNVESMQDIINKSLEYKKNYLKYLSTTNISNNEKLLFFDLLSSGTAQYYLSKCISNEIDGVYVKHLISHNIGYLKIYSYLNDMKTELRETAILESILTSLDPTVDYIDNDGKPVYVKTRRSDKEYKYIIEMHKAIEEFIITYFKKIYISGKVINSKFAYNVFKQYAKTDIADSIFSGVFIDDFDENIAVGDT